MTGAVPSGIGIFLPPSIGGFLLSALFVFGTAWVLAASQRHPRDRAIAVAVWMSALIVGGTQVLSLVRQLHWPGVLLLTGAAAAWAWWWSRARATGAADLSGHAPSLVLPPRGDALLLLACALPVVAYGLWSTWLILASSEPAGDNLTYHVPRLGYW